MRLAAITDWVMNNPETQKLSIGYFGASTGAAAGLMAATKSSVVVVKTIVSRGGRPDLAGGSFYLERVRAPTLLIVGSKDSAWVIGLNQKAMQQLKNVSEKRLIVASGADHLFEEPGILEEVASHAASWFERYLS